MKKTLLLLTLTICSFSFVGAQEIPNYSFENWTGTRPTNWETTNGLMSSPFNNPQTIFQSTDAYMGSYACEIQTKKMRSKPSGVFIPDYAGSMFVGKQISLRSIPGFPYVEQPKTLEFYYKYNARNNDSATIYTLLTKWNTAENKRDTLASNFELITDSVNSYTKREIVLQYLDTVQTPDTAIIFVTSATSHASAEGAKLLIDELAFKGGTVGISSEKQKQTLEVYPNPSQGIFSIQFGLNQPFDEIEIRNIEGRLIEVTHFENCLEIKDVPGLYYLIIKTETGIYHKTLLKN